MTNKEFIRRLRLAKVEALKLWPHEFCIYRAAKDAGIGWFIGMSTFGEGTKWHTDSIGWVRDHAKSPADIARVFDGSIKALGGKP